MADSQNPFINPGKATTAVTPVGGGSNPFVRPKSTSTPTPSISTPPKTSVKTKVGDYIKKNVDLFKKSPTDIAVSAGKAGVEAYTGAVKNLAQQFTDVSQFRKQGTSERLANLIETGTATASVFFAPISAVFESAQKVPLLKPASDLINLPFTVTGKIGEFAGDKFVNALPIPDKDKEILRPAFGEAGSLAGQILLGGKVMDVIMKKGKITPKEIEALKEEAKATPEPVKQYVDSFKETQKTDSPLLSEARKYKSAEEFEKAFTQEIKHGQYWHITDDPNFKIDPNKGPRDMVSTGVGGADKGKLMLTSRLEDWTDTYPNRKYAVLVDMSKVSPKDYYQSNRQFGNEFFVKNSEKAQVVKVVPIEQALKEAEQYRATLPQSKSQLTNIWNEANKTTPVLDKTAPEQTNIPPNFAVSTTGRDLLQKAVEEGIIKDADIPIHEIAKVKDWGAKALDLVEKDPELAKRITQNKELPPEGIPASAIFNAVKEKALRDQDVVTINELAYSELPTEVGRALKGFDSLVEGDPVRAIRQINKELDKTAQKYKKSTTKAVELGKSELKKTSITKRTLSDAIRELECL
jgi:hypothetical protein